MASDFVDPVHPEEITALTSITDEDRQGAASEAASAEFAGGLPILQHNAIF